MARARIGKLTAEIKTVLDEETKDEVLRLANAEGMSISEYLRDLVMIHVHGRDHLLKVHRSRLERMAGVGQDDGQ